MANNTVREYYIAGNKVQYRTQKYRLLDAFGVNVYKKIDPLIVSGTDAVLGHTVTLVEAGAGESTIGYSNVGGGGLLFTTDANEDDGIALQDNDYAFTLASGVKLLYFGARLKLSEATQQDVFVGLSSIDTTPLGGVSDGVFFKKIDGETGISFSTEKSSTETKSVNLATLAADTYVTLEFYCDVPKSRVYAMINGAIVATHLTNIPNTAALSFNFQTLAGSAASRTCKLSWRRIIAIGGRDGAAA